MKRSEFVESELDRLAPTPRAGQNVNVGYLGEEVIYDPVARHEEALRRADAAERAGVTWDPEDPEDPEEAWSRETVRLLVDGQWQYASYAGDWSECAPDPRVAPIYDELARRLLAERAEKPEDMGGEIKEAEAVKPGPRFARITKASKETYWYAKAIGRVFEVLAETPKDLAAVVSPGINWWVDREDCEIIPILRQWPDIGS